MGQLSDRHTTTGMKLEIDPQAPERIVRRDFLKQLAAAGAAAGLAGEPTLALAKDAAGKSAPKIKF